MRQTVHLDNVNKCGFVVGLSAVLFTVSGKK